MPSEPNAQASPPNHLPVPIAIFVSGGGRTLRNIAGRIEAGDLPAKIVLVVASKECPGADFARQQEIRTVIRGNFETPDAVGDLLREAGADWVVLAGYVRLLPIPVEFRGRVVNIHPSLLPKYGGQGMYGQRVHAAVIRAGEVESGCTVHLADGEYDRGEIVAQARCPVLRGDTPETLAARVFELETDLYPKALAELFKNRR
ncbi:MAG: phosphoribosylglycinamide formyltransferase [Phycisphaerales bacterium JB050]